MRISGNYSTNQNYRQNFGINFKPGGKGRLFGFAKTLETQIKDIQNLIEKETDLKRLSELAETLKAKQSELALKKQGIR